jgi:phosphopantothenate synthetase
LPAISLRCGIAALILDAGLRLASVTNAILEINNNNFKIEHNKKTTKAATTISIKCRQKRTFDIDRARLEFAKQCQP